MLANHLAKQERTPQEDVENPVPFLHRNFRCGPEQSASCKIYQDVQVPHLVDRACCSALYLVRIGNVADEGDARAAPFFDLARGRLGQ